MISFYTRYGDPHGTKGHGANWRIPVPAYRTSPVRGEDRVHLHEIRNKWGEQFHGQRYRDWVSKPAMKLIAERGGKK
ncbi:MAG TPA: hypothetical protein VMU05_18960 [Dongiaceae bacterium]|nr:hypothetical protein [Dongiaceae bacterium]